MQINDYLRSKIRDKADELFARLKHLNKFPVRIGSPYNTYRALMPRDADQAIAVLENSEAGFKGILDSNKAAPLYLKIPNPKLNGPEELKVGVSFKFKRPMPSMSVWNSKGMIDTSNEYYPMVREWAIRAYDINRRIDEAENYIRHLTRECNTPGQWYRCFPDFTYFLPEQAKAKIAAMKKASPYPRGIDQSDVIRRTPIVAAELATALLLPEEEPTVWIN